MSDAAPLTCATCGESFRGLRDREFHWKWQVRRNEAHYLADQARLKADGHCCPVVCKRCERMAWRRGRSAYCGHPSCLRARARVAVQRARERRPVAPTMPHVCAVCGRTFTGRRDALTCSARCRQAKRRHVTGG